jgi:methyl-accepting chemotaxis protein
MERQLPKTTEEQIPMPALQSLTRILSGAARADTPAALLGAIKSSQPVGVFSVDGRIVDVNETFLTTLGYARLELIGEHHRVLVADAERASDDDAALWRDLAAGATRGGRFLRVAKGGRPVWLQASYHPVRGRNGRVERVVKVANDITAAVQREAELEAGLAATEVPVSTLAAIKSSQAVIEFAADGRIVDANDNFLAVLGYARQELIGQHHRMFMAEADRSSADYAAFWRDLGAGVARAGRFLRVDKRGRPVWLQASYNPIRGRDGRVERVVKVAADITEAVQREAEAEARLAAIDRSMAVIAFALDGTILEANANFLGALGYTADEIVGRKHSMFIPAAERDSAAYAEFWRALGRGEVQQGRFQRIGKDGRRVWIEASYNPVLGPDGKPAKVVKFATDITALKEREADTESQMAAINRVQATIQFELDGRIVDANENFLRCVGYRLDEVRGQHHRMFVTAKEREGAEYRRFWERLAAGEAIAGEFHRVGKSGNDIWLQASYNPIFGADGKPYKIVKYATDVTAQVKLSRSLRELVTDVRAAAASISQASGEISAGNTDLSARTESAAASLEETAASMEELTATVRANSENARQAAELSAGAATATTRGAEVVRSVIVTMDEIRSSSRRIEEIIGVIDGIAFQTNILALNAAVEAARAGEQGRGFAVVASEVRALAQRCASAAKDIKGLIAAASTSVDQGASRVNEAGKSMGEIQGAIDGLHTLMREITAASQEQAAGIEQVNQTVTHLDQGTQQNAALVEEATAASRSLDEQASGLLRLVSDFMSTNGLGAPEREAAGGPRLRAVG